MNSESEFARANADEQKEFSAAYATIGELVLLASSLDYQLNKIVIEALHLGNEPLIEPVVATLDTSRKLEMLKARNKHIPRAEWRKAVLSYVEKVEKVTSQRNIACHSVVVLDDGKSVFFAPAAKKLLSTLYSPRARVDALRVTIETGQIALSQGQTLIKNLEQLNSKLAQKRQRKDRA